MIRIGSSLRRAGAGLLVLLWLDVATANVVACALDSSTRPEYGQPAMAHALAAHADQHATSSISAHGDCNLPQLLVVSCIRPALFQPPVATFAVVPVLFATPTSVTSPSLRVEPPPPRA